MDLIKQKWDLESKSEFIKYLESMRREGKEEWTRNILNTEMKVLAVKTTDLKKIAKEIKKGDYISFLDLNLDNYYENIAINGFIISSIKDFAVMKKYLDRYILKVDSWGTCDLLKFNVKNNEENYYKLSQEYRKNELPFARRIGMYILFDFIKNDKYVNKIYESLDEFENEQEYYVNMLNAWLVCELFIKRREMTLKYLENNKLNKFTVNKAISKCRDSFRVSKEDKEYLLKFKSL